MIEISATYYDPEQEPVYGFCIDCGGEIYDEEVYDRLGGRCPECYLEHEKRINGTTEEDEE